MDEAKQWVCRWINLDLFQGASEVWAHGMLQFGILPIAAGDETEALHNAVRELGKALGKARLQMRVRPAGWLDRIWPVKPRIFLRDVTPMEVEVIEQLSAPGLEGILFKRFFPRFPRFAR